MQETPRTVAAMNNRLFDLLFFRQGSGTRGPQSVLRKVTCNARPVTPDASSTTVTPTTWISWSTTNATAATAAANTGV